MNEYPSLWPEFYTATILEWKFLLSEEKYKIIIITSLQYLVRNNKIKLYAFVIMSNHIHLIWQVMQGDSYEKIRLSFKKFTAHQIKFELQKSNPELLKEFKVDKKDREYQFWKRDALSIELFTDKVFQQKLNYIHNNPVKASMCKFPEEYKYSSANFYNGGNDEFEMITEYTF
jgi:REP element-mobilizing transposase RayT